ncbi:hypothetical protein B7463_g1563, partial [Scytalidium lignicola]
MERELFRRSADAPEVVLNQHPYSGTEADKMTYAGDPNGYWHPNRVQTQALIFEPLADNKNSGRRICGLTIVVFVAIVGCLSFIVGGVVGGGIGGAIVSKNHEPSTITIAASSTSPPASATAQTTASSSPLPPSSTTTTTASSSTTNTVIPTVITNPTGCNANNGTIYKSTRYPGSSFEILCNTDLKANTDIGKGQIVTTLGECFDNCAAYNNASQTPECVGAVWVIFSGFNPDNDSRCFLKGQSVLPVGDQGQILAGGILVSG